MRQVMVRYKVRPDDAERNEQLVRAVFDELDRVQPKGFRYATFVLDDGVSFVHVVRETGHADVSLNDMPAFQAFVAGVNDRCDEPPVASSARVIGSYGLLADWHRQRATSQA